MAGAALAGAAGFAAPPACANAACPTNNPSAATSSVTRLTDMGTSRWCVEGRNVPVPESIIKRPPSGGSMADKEKDQQAAFGRIVDRLLKKLPGADPHLIGDRARVNVSSVPHVPHAGRAEQPVPSSARLAVWGRVFLGVVLGVVVNQWPY